MTKGANLTPLPSWQKRSLMPDKAYDIPDNVFHITLEDVAAFLHAMPQQTAQKGLTLLCKLIISVRINYQSTTGW